MYGLIEPSEWHQPDWIDEERATAAREEMIRKKVIYGHSVPYRNMCRYNSGVSIRGSTWKGWGACCRARGRLI